MPVFDLDPEGTLADNLITDEHHIANTYVKEPYDILFIKNAPFHINDLIITQYNVDQSSNVLLTTEYRKIIPYSVAAKAWGKSIYGAVAVPLKTGTSHYTVTYRTIGGSWVNNVSDTIAKIEANYYNPKIVYYDQLVGDQTSFPPREHGVETQDLLEYEAVLDGLRGISDAIGVRDSAILEYMTTGRHLEIHNLQAQVTDLQAQINELSTIIANQ